MAKKRQTYHSFTVENLAKWSQRELGDFDSPSTALAVSGALDTDAFVLSAEEVRLVAEGKATFPCLQPELRLELARRCAEQIDDSALVEAWARCLGVVSAISRRRDLEKVRKSG